jgi:hypothetical protein
MSKNIIIVLTYHRHKIFDIIIIIINCNWAYARWQCYKKNGRTYKKWTYVARKQNIHLTKKQHISLCCYTRLVNSLFLKMAFSNINISFQHPVVLI